MNSSGCQPPRIARESPATKDCHVMKSPGIVQSKLATRVTALFIPAEPPGSGHCGQTGHRAGQAAGPSQHRRAPGGTGVQGQRELSSVHRAGGGKDEPLGGKGKRERTARETTRAGRCRETCAPSPAQSRPASDRQQHHVIPSAQSARAALRFLSSPAPSGTAGGCTHNAVRRCPLRSVMEAAAAAAAAGTAGAAPAMAASPRAR